MCEVVVVVAVVLAVVVAGSIQNHYKQINMPLTCSSERHPYVLIDIE